MPTPSARRPTIGPVVAPRIGRQRSPWQDEDPVAVQDAAGSELPPDEVGTGRGTGVVGLLVVVLILLVALPVAFWFMDYGGLNPFAAESAGAAQPPAALPGKGSYVDARVQPGGTVRVTQWVRPPSRLRSVDVKAQARSGPDAAASGLRLTADGRPVAGPSDVGHVIATFQWRRPARMLRLTYTLDHVVSPKRTTARLTVLASTFLAVRYPDRTGPTVVRVSGAGMEGIACAPVLGHAPPAPCGRQVTGAAWQVSLTGADFTHRVLARVGAS